MTKQIGENGQAKQIIINVKIVCNWWVEIRQNGYIYKFSDYENKHFKSWSIYLFIFI